MKLLIFGATGKTGHHLTSQALEEGHAVIAFARDPSRMKISHKRLEVFKGNLNHDSGIENALAGCDAVLSSLGASSPFRFDAEVVNGFEHIVRAMERSAVKRIVYMSFVGVTDSRKTGGFIIRNIAPRLLRTEIAGHELREKKLRESTLDWTFVRAATLTNGKRSSSYRSGEGIRASGMTAMISRADVAEFMLKKVTDTNSIRKSPSIFY